MFSFYKISKPF